MRTSLNKSSQKRRPKDKRFSKETREELGSRIGKKKRKLERRKIGYGRLGCRSRTREEKSTGRRKGGRQAGTGGVWGQGKLQHGEECLGEGQREL